MMRLYLKEGDLISAEVQMVYSEGALGLHTRSLKHGKLGQGTMVKVLPSLVRRWKTHFHSLPCGVSLIIGNNGFIWVYPTAGSNMSGGFVHNFNVNKYHMINPHHYFKCFNFFYSQYRKTTEKQ